MLLMVMLITLLKQLICVDDGMEVANAVFGFMWI
jgi:hypothetical protein